MDSEKLNLLYELLKEFNAIFIKFDELNSNFGELRSKHEKVLNTILNETKPFLSLEEAADYISISKSDLYKRTSLKTIPFYKPGKQIYFKREDLDNYILSFKQ